MLIDLQSRGFALTPAMRLHVERRLGFALSIARGHVARAVVRLSDDNGPRGGKDKRCTLRLCLHGMNDVVIEDTQADLYVAIDSAADRLGRVLSRKLARSRLTRPWARGLVMQ